ncbi:MAG: protein kinase, partial [Rhodospirillales bacterium]|nr:protein kinase [Rhodospirillales bacterium]
MTGLQFSHGSGVVHRDIKPANIMLTKAGEVKIADFGIARIESSSMTQAGTMLGTPSYMSPEQFMGQTVDARTDIYSSGVMLYQLLTGEKPFDGGLTAIMHKVLHTEPPAPSALSVSVTPALDAVVKKAMAKRPEDRFDSAQDFAQALRDTQDAKPASAESFSLGLDDFNDGEATMVAPRRPAQAAPPLPASAPAKKKGPSPMLLGGGAIALLAILGGGGYALFGGHKQAAPQMVAQTAPTQPAPAQPQPAAPTPPPPPPQMSAAQRQAAITATLGTLPCTLLNATSQNILTGLAGAGAPQAALTSALQSLPSGQSVTNQAQTIDGPYCAALDAVRPYHPLFPAAGGVLGLMLAGGKTILHDGDLITIDQTMPNFSGYLETDYFSSDGTVLHLYPTTTDAARQFSAGATKVLGDPTHGGASWQVSAPYGTDMIITIASSTPLFSKLRPQDENASDYLPALRMALQNAASNGAQISVAAIPVVTLPKTSG